MAKDPATLWYWGDWAGGTATFTRHMKGCYMDLLNAQFNNGHLSLEEIKTVLGSDFGSTWPTLQKKFVTDPQGNFFNERAELEKQKRIAFTESRKSNLKGHKGDHVQHHKVHLMENENRNESINGNAFGKSENLLTDEGLAYCFGDAYIEALKLGKAYPGVDIDLELLRFKSKVMGSTRVYAGHNTDGLRLAFCAQLRSAKPTTGTPTKRAKAFEL